MSLFIAGCATTSGGPTNVTDSNLPKVMAIRTVVSTNSVGLEWDNPKDPNVDGFYIYRAELNQPMSIVGTVKNRFSTHYLDSDLKPATSYRYMMKTYSKNGVSADGVTVTATTAKAIDSVSYAQAIYGLPEQVKIIWRPHANLRVDSYIIERRKAGSQSWSKIAEVKGRLSAEYIDTSVGSGKSYEYRVRVKTLDGEISEPSAILNAITKELPDGVINLSATKDQPKKIVLTWDSPANSNFSHYQIYSSRLEALGFLPLAKTDKNFYEDLINTNGATRYYKVTFVDKDGLESASNDKPVVGKTLDSLPAPVMSDPFIDSSSVVLNWQTGAQGSKYTLLRTGGGADKSINDIRDNRYVDRDISKGNSYTYRVIAVDEYGINSDRSNSVTINY